MIRATIAAFAALIFASMPDAFADDLAGRASVIDGDTLEIHGTRIRLWGIDAPESSQLCRGEDSLQYRCGAKSANDLDAFIGTRPVNCLPFTLDQYGRTVASCSVEGVDLGQWRVRNGLALDWPQYSKRKYVMRSVKPSKPGEGYGQAAMSSRGYIEYAFGRAEVRPIARMMRTRIRRSKRESCGSR